MVLGVVVVAIGGGPGGVVFALNFAKQMLKFARGRGNGPCAS